MEIEDAQNKSKESKMAIALPSPQIKEVKKEDSVKPCYSPGTPLLKLELINCNDYAYCFSNCL